MVGSLVKRTRLGLEKKVIENAQSHASYIILFNILKSCTQLTLKLHFRSFVQIIIHFLFWRRFFFFVQRKDVRLSDVTLKGGVTPALL